ncbi:MAG: thioesterase family protein [Candidatus Methanomethylophilus sp.]|nr:thioesterase family protein [Methanomethylophilus sp.]
MINVGDFGESRLTVTEKDTAEAWGSGTLPVLATPRMILMIEETACDALKGKLPEGDTSVGTLVDVAHVSASPVGSEVVCRTEVVEIDRARIRFKVTVTDAFGDVGTGFHERFIVHSDKFMAKANAKL